MCRVLKRCVAPAVIMSFWLNLLSAILTTLGQDSCSELSNAKLSVEFVPATLEVKKRSQMKRLDALFAGA